MFKSRTRPIIIPQAEHSRLSGVLAHLWGNPEIAAPPIDHAAFTLGVTHHDRGYGSFDTLAIGEVDDEIWLATQQHGIEVRLANATADSVALMHIRRLLSYADHAGAQPIIALAEQRIADTIARTPYTREVFEQADSITRLCDRIAFDFSFEAPSQFETPVFSDGELRPIQVQIEAGQINLHPWPLAVPAVRGFIIGYEASGYPERREPVLVEFTIRSQR
jgi:hypothetical protein